MNNRGIGQKIAYGTALFSYCSAIVLAYILITYDQDTGTADSIIASMMAGIVFLIGVGIVLHVIGKANLPDLRIRKEV
ncbi:MAG: hemerythrin family protein [Gammaproteobacteria bacterium]|jgi:formate hydrogenlyase subunit 3/multisubunit Na+/H+ antiporter MnhD subunit|nr:hemerythrin family protein [Gammaproteobacteria bacterium]MBT4608334.1 hemerythrin family protein [Thiotrichales bacterium]MBT3471637.1 hemerythrin family protein [Gammaproteobacteria bacterium]MBT3968554.1 hemerythrin family protein [Gammaproteobacteria bacterium]MBT4080572.1 hemerythrin family protein [Gammaproteobacteria bacterium]